MKTNKFKNYEDFKKEIENLKKKHEYFFADAKEEIIYTREKRETFLSFYLDVLVMVTNHNYDELTSFTTTYYHFYLCKSAIFYSKKDFKIMLDRLGYNFDDYDQEFTDKIGVFY